MLLLDGLADIDDQHVFHMMHKEGAFQRLVELIRDTNVDEQKNMHRLLLQLIYEMSRIQRLTAAELGGMPGDVTLGMHAADASYSCG